MQEEIKHIIGTDLLDYSFKVEQAIKEGWTFSDKNEYAPRAWPHMFEAFMVKITNEIELGLNIEENTTESLYNGTLDGVEYQGSNQQVEAPVNAQKRQRKSKV